MPNRKGQMTQSPVGVHPVGHGDYYGKTCVLAKQLWQGEKGGRSGRSGDLNRAVEPAMRQTQPRRESGTVYGLW